MVIGHDDIRSQLERQLPPVTLLLGPASIGKRVLASHLAVYHGVHAADTHGAWELRAAAARTARHLAQVAPFGPFRVFLFDLDGSSEGDQNALLKVLEEPPPTVRFLLVASERPLATVMSRSTLYRLSLLSDNEVCQVLSGLGLPLSEANRFASVGRGQVAPALAAATSANEDDRPRAVLAAAIKAAQSHDLVLYQAAVRNWDEVHSRLAGEWAQEAATGRWLRFDAKFAPGVSPDQAREVLEWLTAYSNTRLRGIVALQKALAHLF